MRLSYNKSTNHLILSLYSYENKDIVDKYGFKKINDDVFTRKFNKKVVKGIFKEFPKLVDIEENILPKLK